MQNKIVKVCAKGKSLARKVCVACSILVATLVVGNLVSVNKVQAGGMSAPGFTAGIPVYADLPVGFYYVNQSLSSYTAEIRRSWTFGPIPMSSLCTTKAREALLEGLCPS